MLKRIAVGFMAVALLLFSGCGLRIEAEDLMRGITPRPVTAVALEGSSFIDSAASFSVDLFRESFAEDENSLISPVSVLLALAMTANGAKNTTLSQMEAVLGGGLEIQELNRYLYSFVNGLHSEKKSRLEIANSIWFRENDFTVNRDFLQTNADYFGADAYSAPFNDRTVRDINNWVKRNTDKMIDSIIDRIPPEAVMYLINTVLFDAEWARIYERSDIRSGQFTAFDGARQTVEFMNSNESRFIQDDNAVGFIKPYHGNHYSFAALLPDENVSIHDYVASLTGERLIRAVNNAQTASVWASLPKFEYDFELSMNDALKALGMVDAFCEEDADLTGIGRAGWGNGNLFINNVQHKTFISVNERGTRAGAVTSVEINGPTSVPEFVYVILDRPFLYAIIDNATGLPVFMGTVISMHNS